MANKRRKVAVILGAGASKDAAGASPVKHEVHGYTPPLAKELFGNAAKYENIENILQRYPGAAHVRELVVATKDQTSIGIENELRRIANQLELFTAYKHVPPYLRDYLDVVSRNHTTTPGMLVRLATDLLIEDPHEVGFIVLNYDTFLEQALSLPPWGYAFDSIGRYINTGEQFQLFKVHGSVNWAVLMDRPSGTWEEAVAEYNLDLSDRDIRMFTADRAINSIQDEGRWYYPVLTAPLAEKSDSDLVCPPAHREALATFLSECKKYLIIGTSGFDQDLLAQIAEHAPEPEVVHYVCGDESDTARDNFESGIPQFRSLTGGNRRAFNLRFGEYLNSEHISRFLKAPG